jgi:hypothetical protein
MLNHRGHRARIIECTEKISETFVNTSVHSGVKKINDKEFEPGTTFPLLE